ncbi:unnamed protein product, partial [Arabidopsis halleri]
SGTPPPNVPSKTDISKSNHRYLASPTNESSNEWQVVKNKSKPLVNKALVKEVEPNQGGSSVTAAQFAEEEEAIQIGQRIIRRRSSSPQRPPTILPDQSNKPLTSITSQPSAGIITTSKEQELKSWVSSSRLSIGAILETHVQHDNAAAILARIFPGWRHEFNYLPTASNGRIWLVWNPAVKVFIYKKTDQLISCGVFDPSTCESFSVTFVYARNCLIARRDLWVALEELHNHSLQRNHPWLILGDFNQILIAEDHYSLLPYTLPLQGMNEFQSCIDTCELLHLSSRGAEHTWYNGQPSNPITRKLDRALINESWLMAFPQSSLFVDAPGGSDHSPLLISTSDSVERRKVPFKFYSFFTTHPDFPSIVESAWNLDLAHTSTMFSLCQRLKAVKLGCKALNRTSFSNIQARSAEAHDMLTSIQNQLLTSPSPALFEEEKEQRRRWSFFAAAEESFLMQKSRIRWITDKILLKQLVVDYYQNLLGTRNTSVLPLTVERIRELNSFRCTATLATQLTSIPTPEEVTSTVFSLPRNKAPGPDGFTVDFFINSWSVVGPSLIAAVQLDLATTSGRIQAHPLCVNPLVTHLSFADDILVFFNGQEASLIAILDVLAQFKSVSGLGINLSKSCLFLDGSNFDLISQISSRHNLTHGSLPIRYLGAGSLWVSWVKNHLIRGRCFWDADFRFTGSWIWRRLSKLRVLARPFIFCSVQSGCLALFWHDNWTNLGPLIDIVGPAGPRVTGIGLLATVSEAVVNDAWFLPRGRHPLVQLLRNCLLSHPPPLESETRKDLFLWKIDADQAQGHFSSSKTWKHLHPPGPTKAWFTQVWFKERIPKLAFMFWLTVQDRLTTRDRLRRWNLPIPAACLLCQTDEESRDHLFFQCTYSNTLWLELFGRFSPSPST